MKIGIDISQTAYENTGVANYLSNLVVNLLNSDKKNEYILFFSSLRKKPSVEILKSIEKNPRSKLINPKLPPSALNVLWNDMHIVPIEVFIGKVDLFITSDWTEPPAKARKATIIYDMIVYKHPLETDQKIISVQKRKLKWVKKESDIVFCISNSTKKDTEEILGLNPEKVRVIYPGI